MSDSPASALRFRRLLITGAAGSLGHQMRGRLHAMCDALRLSDVAPLSAAAPHEECVQVALEDGPAVRALLHDVDAVIHFGGVSTEAPWAPILKANIEGVVNLYEAARHQGVKRIIFASSNHAIGCYRQDETIDTKVPTRPDGLYGLSKAFGENCAQMYWDRFGIETVSVRIGSSFPEPVDRRMLATWLSFDDLERLIVAALTSPIVGHTVMYGMSDNPHVFWDNRHAKHVGYQPRDSSAPFRAALEAKQQTIDTKSPVAIHQGGGFMTKWFND